MRMHRGPSRRGRIALATTVAALATAGSAAAFQALPPGSQVNDDPAAGINKAISVSGEDPTNADLVGGALTAGKPAVPWAIFRQRETNGAEPPADQVFVRSFANGAWTTRGDGTVGGRSSTSPQFRGSLNFDQGQDGEAPSIDFAGAGRTVPWATWYENTKGAGFGKNNVFASRFDNTGDANQGKWICAGQSRGNGGSNPDVPSLNIHTDQDAENPSVAGGSAVDPTKPGPWITWQETSNSNGQDQIFVDKPEVLNNCDGVTPAGKPDIRGGPIPAIGGFCFQDVGIARAGQGNHDPSLNVDVNRNGIEPDIAFTGANDSVPWVVWYETGNGTPGLAGNEMVFAAKGEADTGAGVLGGFHWHVFGNNGNGILNGSTSCAASLSAEQACSLNSDPGADAEDPQVAAGTMNPANPTVPWVTWDETVGGVKQVFVSRFVATPTPHFQIVNGGQPVSTPGIDSTRADITFSGNTPYVTWREETSSGTRGFVGHFVNAANPTFVLDESDVPLTPTGDNPGQADVREPISSSCTANPFNADGAACQGGAVGTPFLLFTNGTNPLGLFADAYQPGTPVTGGASGISTSAATVSGSVDPKGAPIKVLFQFGTTTAYGQSTGIQTLAPSNAATPFAAQLTGLPAGTTIHYRAVATSDFGTFAGPDQTLTTGTLPPPPPPPAIGTVTVGHARVSVTTAAVRVACAGAPGARCKLTLRMTVTETFRGHRLVAVAARLRHQVVGVGSASVTLTAGGSQTVRISLNRAGRNLLASRHVLKVRLAVSEALGNGQSATVSTQTVTFKARSHRHGRH
jgi:hypothetical protein